MLDRIMQAALSTSLQSTPCHKFLSIALNSHRISDLLMRTIRFTAFPVCLLHNTG